jgi:DNA-directed RNA polymerase subunit M/transcription elongation factor TFIIS
MTFVYPYQTHHLNDYTCPPIKPYAHFDVVITAFYNKLPLTSPFFENGEHFSQCLWRRVVIPQVSAGHLSTSDATSWITVYLQHQQTREATLVKKQGVTRIEPTDDDKTAWFISEVNQFLSKHACRYIPLVDEVHVKTKEELSRFVETLNPYRDMPKLKATTAVCERCGSTPDDYVRTVLVQTKSADEPWTLFCTCTNPVHGEKTPYIWKE